MERLIEKFIGKPTIMQSDWLKIHTQVHTSEYRRTRTYEELDADEEELERLYKGIIPEVGLKCTEVLYSDTYAHTITEVINPNKIKIRKNDYHIKDWVNGEGEILDELVGAEFTITRRKSGNWRAEGSPDKRGEVFYTLAYARTYRDPSF